MIVHSYLQQHLPDHLARRLEGRIMEERDRDEEAQLLL